MISLCFDKRFSMHTDVILPLSLYRTDLNVIKPVPEKRKLEAVIFPVMSHINTHIIGN